MLRVPISLDDLPAIHRNRFYHPQAHHHGAHARSPLGAMVCGVAGHRVDFLAELFAELEFD